MSGSPVLSLSDIIGRPLYSAMDVQTSLSNNTLNFIKQICIDVDEKTIRSINFQYNNTVITIPLVTLLTIPSMTLNALDVEFSVAVKQINTYDTPPTYNNRLVGIGDQTASYRFKMNAVRQESRGIQDLLRQLNVT